MDLQIIPVDRETGETFTFDPAIVKKMDNSELTSFLSNLKIVDKIKKEAEKEVKERLDKGQHFTRLSYGKPQYQRVIVSDNILKAVLLERYGWDALEPLTVTQLKKKFGEAINPDIEPYIVEKPKAPAIKWDA